MSIPIRVFVIEPHAIIRLGMCAFLLDFPELEVVGNEASIPEAIELCDQLQLKTDIFLFHEFGAFENVEPGKLLAASPEAMLLVMGRANDIPGAPKLFIQSNRCCFFEINSSKQCLEAILQAQKKPPKPHKPNEKGRLSPTTPINPLDTLSERELQVLLLLSHGIKHETICTTLKIGMSTLKTYRARFTEKLGLQNDIELINLLNLHGWLDKPYTATTNQITSTASLEEPLTA